MHQYLMFNYQSQSKKINSQSNINYQIISKHISIQIKQSPNSLKFIHNNEILSQNS
jgi:hypothetical protein